MDSGTYDKDRPNLVLAGFMGTGKSTVGLLLARLLDRPFVDTDQVIEAMAGLRVSDIFERQGERTFRAYERIVCSRLARHRGQVIATGGGALLDPSNRAALERTGIIVLLTCERHELIRRLEESNRRAEDEEPAPSEYSGQALSGAKGRSRPLLRQGFEETVHRLLRERELVYSAIALKVDTTHLSPAEVADEVLALYRVAAQDRLQAGVP